MHNLRGQWIIQTTHPLPVRAHPSARTKSWSAIKPAWATAAGTRAGTCRTCDATVYGLPLNTHSSALYGPATVRISTASLANV